MNPIPFIPAERRVRRKHKSVTVTSLAVVAVQDVSIDEDEVHLTLVFNTTVACPLVGVAEADPAKWNLRYQGLRYDGVTLTAIDYRSVTLDSSQAYVDPGADELVYLNDPSDIGDEAGRSLAAFAIQY